MPDPTELDSSSLEQSANGPLTPKPIVNSPSTGPKPVQLGVEKVTPTPRKGTEAKVQAETAGVKPEVADPETPEAKLAREKREKVEQAIQGLKKIIENNKNLTLLDSQYRDMVSGEMARINMDVISLDDAGRSSRDIQLRRESERISEEVRSLISQVGRNVNNLERQSAILAVNEISDLDRGQDLMLAIAYETDPVSIVELRNRVADFLSGLDSATILTIDSKYAIRNQIQRLAVAGSNIRPRLPEGQSQQEEHLRDTYIRLNQSNQRLENNVGSQNVMISKKERDLIADNSDRIREILALIDNIEVPDLEHDGSPSVEATQPVNPTLTLNNPGLDSKTRTERPRVLFGPMVEGTADLLADPSIGEEFREALARVQTAPNVSDADRLREQENMTARFAGLREGILRLEGQRGPNINEATLPPTGPVISEIRPFLRDDRLRAEVRQELNRINNTPGLTDEERIRKQQLLAQRARGLLEALRRDQEMDQVESGSGHDQISNEGRQSSESARDQEPEVDDPEAKRSPEEEAQRQFELQFLGLCKRKYLASNPEGVAEGREWINYVNQAIKTFGSEIITPNTPKETVDQFNMFRLSWLLTPK